MDNSRRMNEGHEDLISIDLGQSRISFKEERNEVGDDDSQTSCSTLTSSSKKSVSFGCIEVREYNRIIGDNPDVAFGIPIGIGWDYLQRASLPLDNYEEKRQLVGNFRLSSAARRRILDDAEEVSEQEIIIAEKKIQRHKKKKENTMKRKKKWEKVKSLFTAENVLNGVANVAGFVVPMPSSTDNSYSVFATNQ